MRLPNKTAGGEDLRAWSLAKLISSTPDVAQCLADCLLLDRTKGDDLAAVRALAQSVHGDVTRLHTILCERITRGASTIADVLATLLLAFASAGSAPSELQSKFSHAGAYELKHLDLAAYFGGLERRIGAPAPGSMEMVLQAMEHEHVRMPPESDETFHTQNYAVTTCSATEWKFVVEPLSPPPGGWPTETKNAEVPSGGGTRSICRTPLNVEALQAKVEEVNRTLSTLNEPTVIWPEAVGGRLYTGPLFFKYNAVLRGLDSDVGFLRALMLQFCSPRAVHAGYVDGSLTYDEAKRHLNKYTTTLHVINSLIVKVGKTTKASKVYRGVSGGVLPESFWTPNELGIMGGVEPGFMSTTLEREVAVGYAGNSPERGGIVLEIQQGMTSRGADISWLSQVRL